MPDTLAPARKWFDEWRQKNSEPCPDFDAMPACADLPPLLKRGDGVVIGNVTDWAPRRKELLASLHHWFWGSFPQNPPRFVGVKTLTEEREAHAMRRRVELEFDAKGAAVRFVVDLFIPEGKGPFPVFLTQSTHRGWSAIGVSRGYLCCTYPACDGDDASLHFVPHYPECDWTTIPRRAWLTSRVLDFLLTLPETDSRCVGVSGHSRNGKLSLIAAATDPRITAVVSSSSGAGGASPYRFTSEVEFAESLDCTTWMCPDWFHPRLRFFVGREHKLPTDTHAYMGLIAPRACLISTAWNDGCESPYAIERGVMAARPVYALHGKADNLQMLWRPGGHETSTHLIENYFDWFDQHAGRSPLSAAAPPLLQFDWRAWQQRNANTPLPSRHSADSTPKHRREAIEWSLGEEPPVVPHFGDTYGADASHVSAMLVRGTPPAHATRVGIQFANYIPGDLYLPKSASPQNKAPVIIWLHPFSAAQGYRGSYVVEHDTWKPYLPYDSLTQAGFACLAFDQLGHGTRQLEGADFDRRYPRWSRLGRMVADVRGAIDFLRSGDGRVPPVVLDRWKPDLSMIDTDRIYVLGYSLGGLVGLYAAALDERVKGVASFSAITPMRTNSDDKPTGGLRRLWEWYGLQPRLGLFHGREQELPFDFDDVISLIAPRPTLIVSPLHDRFADATDLTRCIAAAKRHYPDPARLTHSIPNDYSRFQTSQHRQAIEWLAAVARTP